MRTRIIKSSLVGVAALIILIAVSWIWNAPRDNLRGVWASDGYGLYVDVGRVVIDVYQVTEVSCLRDMRIPAHLWAIKALEGVSFDRAGDRLRLEVTGSLNPIYADRAPTLPAHCAKTETPGTQAENYAVFWNAMAEHYPFFDLHGVDWASRQTPSSDDLWQAITSAMDGLDDGHLYIHDGEQVYSPSVRPDWYEDRHAVRDATRASIVGGLSHITDSGLWIGRASDDVAYVYIEHMETDTSFGGLPSDTAKQAMAKVIAAFPRARAFIIDVRYNPGGSDDIALAYASFFTRTPTIAFSKSTRTRNGFTAQTEVMTQPDPRAVDKPVYLLTSGFTGSAAEIFTLAMRELPNVTTMGTPTGGGLSDVLNFSLPNGWELGLSHQIYLAPDGSAFEGVGIPPDVTLPVDVAAYKAGHDPLIAAALAEFSET
jgi:hypothetical protein